MFKQSKGSVSLVVTSGTLFSTLMVSPSTSVVTNAVKENKDTGISNALWWVFTFVTFGFYAIYWCIFGNQDEELPIGKGNNLPVSSNNKKDNNTSNMNEELKKDQLKLQSADKKAEVSENEKVVQGFKEKLKEAKNKKEQLARDIEILEWNVKYQKERLSELPRQMVLEFNKNAEEFNKKIGIYREDIEKYKENNKNKIQREEEKLLLKKKKGEKIAIDVAEKGDVYGLMEKLEEEFLKPINFIDENTLDEKLNFKSYNEERDRIFKIKLKWEDFQLFGNFLMKRRDVFARIREDCMIENKEKYNMYSKNYQSNWLKLVELKEKLSKADEEISELKASLEIYEKELEKETGDIKDGSIKQENTNVV